jgi:hypothetical protein
VKDFFKAESRYLKEFTEASVFKKRNSLFEVKQPVLSLGEAGVL